MKVLFRALLSVAFAAGAQAQSFTPDFTLSFGSPITFATHAQLASYGFQYGPSDGTSGGIPSSGNTYTFYCDIPGHESAGMEGTLVVG